MDVNRILSELDAEIARLQQIRNALTGLGQGTAVTAASTKKPGRGRPKGSKNAAKTATTTAKTVAAKTVAAKPAAAKKGKRKLSPEGRKRIADAMKRRWAERRKQVAKSAPSK